MVSNVQMVLRCTYPKCFLFVITILLVLLLTTKLLLQQTLETDSEVIRLSISSSSSNQGWSLRVLKHTSPRCLPSPTQRPAKNLLHNVILNQLYPMQDKDYILDQNNTKKNSTAVITKSLNHIQHSTGQNATKDESNKCSDNSLVLVDEGFLLPSESSKSNSTKDGQGLILTIVNQHNGRSIFQKVFPLWRFYAHWSDLKLYISQIAAGRIVIMAISVTGTMGLRDATQTLTKLGSMFALHLTPSSHWVWIYVQKGKTVHESVVLQGPSQIHADIIFPCDPVSVISSNILEAHRWEFCNKHGAMGGLCDENQPDPVPPLNPPNLIINQTALDGVPIIITAGSRHEYLYYTLIKLLHSPGANKNNIVIALGDTTPSTVELLQLLQISYVHINNSYNIGNMTDKNQKLFLYYKSVFEMVSIKFQNVSTAIFLDEDVEVSPDFFSYMSQTIWLLEKDPSLYCINAFSQMGINGTFYNSSSIFRGQVQVEWGFALTLDFIKEALEIWSTDINNKDPNMLMYDNWIYNTVRGKRECVFPGISRTKHYGVGVNDQPMLKEHLYINMPVVQDSPIHIPDVKLIIKPLWRENLNKIIKNSTLLEGNPCTKKFIPRPIFPQNYTFFYRLDSDKNSDFDQYDMVAKCCNSWHFSFTGLHEGVTIVSPSPNVQIFLVGVPYSSYSSLKPKNVTAFDIDSLSDEDYWKTLQYGDGKEINGLEKLIEEENQRQIFIESDTNFTITGQVIDKLLTSI